MKISVVVPVYNAEKYIEKCIKSIIEQTYQNLELILIDDGSEDGTGSICNRFAAADPRIHVFHQPNKGMTASRREGLKHCCGDYIMFVDSDDCLQGNIIGIFAGYIHRYHAEVICCNYSIDGKTVTGITEVEKVGKEALIREILTKKKTDGNLWAKIYRQDLITNAQFSAGVNDDFLIVADIAERTKGVILFIPETGYSYTIVKGSLSHREFKMDDLLYMEATSRYASYVIKQYPERRQEAEYFYLSSVVYVRTKMEKSDGLDKKMAAFVQTDSIFRKNIRKIVFGGLFTRREKINAFLIYTGLFRIVRKVIYTRHVSG